MYGGQGTTFGSGSFLQWALGIKLKLLGLHSTCFDPLIRHASLLLFCFKNIVLLRPQSIPWTYIAQVGPEFTVFLPLLSKC